MSICRRKHETSKPYKGWMPTSKMVNYLRRTSEELLGLWGAPSEAMGKGVEVWAQM